MNFASVRSTIGGGIYDGFLVVLSKFTMSPTVRQKVRLTIHKQQITYNIFLYIYFLRLLFLWICKISTEKGVTTTKVILIYDLKLLTWYIPNKVTTCCELHTYTFKAMTSHIIHYHALHLEKYKNLENYIHLNFRNNTILQLPGKRILNW